jgi:hypothetical protein
MNLVIIALFVSLAGSAITRFAGTPDFSGSWRLDATRSDATAYDNTPGPVTIAIKQSNSEVHIVTTTTRGSSDITYRFVRGDAPPLASGPNARWQGDTLVTHAIRDISGQSVTVEQRRRLSADGREMTVESIVNVQHGYTATGAQTYGISTDVFVRLP